jgi:hypothetical protein
MPKRLLVRIAHLRKLSLLIAAMAHCDAEQFCNLQTVKPRHYMPAMGQTVQRAHFVDKQVLDRLNTVIVLVLVGSGLAACVVGAFAYDVGRLLSAW